MSIPVPMRGFGGGGGAALNFDVKAYATEEALLADTPKENTIGIITTNKITGWMLTPGDIGENKQSANLYTTTGATNGAYLDDDGSEVSNNTYLITKYIQLPDNTKSLTATFPYTNEDFIAFYNSDKTFISTVQYKEGLATYSVPDGTRYIRVSYHVDEEPPTIYANYVVAQDFAEGTVIIQTGTDSKVGFNALKKNGIQVYPISAQQFVNGALVDVVAKTYQGGEWVGWRIPFDIFKSGVGEIIPISTEKQTNSSISVSTDAINVSWSGSGYTFAYFWTTGSFDVTKYRSFCVETNLTNATEVYIGLTDSNGKVIETNLGKFTSYTTITNTGENIQKLDITNLSGNYYLAYAGKAKGKILNIYLEN